MKLEFATSKMQRTCSSDKEMRKKHGDQMAKKLQQRLAELEAASTLADMPKVPPARCHELTGDRKGQFSVDLVHPYRLIFEPGHNLAPRKEDGGLDLDKITCVVVLEIVDTHS